jgi:hypothetical protein
VFLKPEMCLRMKTLLGMVLVFTATVSGQTLAPSSPLKFGKRDLGGGFSSGTGAVDAKVGKSEPTTRVVSYFSFGETRQWKSVDGRCLVGRMIAFGDATVEVMVPNAEAAKAGALSVPPPVPPEKFVLIHEGKIRLLVNNRPFEVALARLSEEDRAYVRKLEISTNGSGDSR